MLPSLCWWVQKWVPASTEPITSFFLHGHGWLIQRRAPDPHQGNKTLTWKFQDWESWQPLWVAWITKYKIRNCQHVPWGRRERLCEDENKAVAQGWDRGERETPDRLDSLTSWSWDTRVLPPISSVSEGKLNWVPATGHQQSQRNDPHTHYKWCSNWRQSSEDLLRTEVLSNRHGRELRVR